MNLMQRLMRQRWKTVLVFDKDGTLKMGASAMEDTKGERCLTPKDIETRHVPMLAAMFHEKSLIPRWDIESMMCLDTWRKAPQREVFEALVRQKMIQIDFKSPNIKYFIGNRPPYIDVILPLEDRGGRALFYYRENLFFSAIAEMVPEMPAPECQVEEHTDRVRVILPEDGTLYKGEDTENLVCVYGNSFSAEARERFFVHWGREKGWNVKSTMIHSLD